jgi:hypothetical protein
MWLLKERSARGEERKTSLDALQREDLLLRDYFARIGRTQGGSVEQRYDYGNVAKQIIRHVGVRQAALVDVANSISVIPSLGPIATRMIERATSRRELISELVHMSRSVQGMYLNTGQDFDHPLTSLMTAISVEIDWELSEAVPSIRQVLDTPAKRDIFRSARYVTRHAPTSLSTSGPRWYERAPVVSRIRTILAQIYPRAARNERVS